MQLIIAALTAIAALPKLFEKFDVLIERVDAAIEYEQLKKKALELASAIDKAKKTKDSGDLERLLSGR
jgi:uncharacterized membrane protein (DUF106 family)